MYLLKGYNLSYWIYQKVHIDQKYAYRPKMCLLKKIKSHNCSMFLNVYVILIYLVMWRNQEQSIKSQIFRLLVII